MPRTGRVSRFKRRDSDRSGFEEWEISMMKDGPWTIAPEEYDTPPPSRLSLGGEGDKAPGQDANFAFLISSVTAPITNIQVQGLLASTKIQPSTTQPWVRIFGSGGTVDLTSNPQMSAGKQGQIQTLECVSNNVILDTGSGLTLSPQGQFNMGSGAIMTLVYNTGNSTWIELTRDRL